MTHPRAALQLAAALLCAAPALFRAMPSQEPGAPAPAPAPGAQPAATRAELATVVLVRHAEKGDDDPRDPGLSARGAARAEALAALFSRAGVSHLFTSEYRRTEATLAPLARRTGLTPVALPARELGRLVQELRALPAGSVAVVCGHSNTVPALARALGVELADLVDSRGGKVLDESVYDRVWILTHAVGAADGAAAPAARALELSVQLP